MNKISSSSLTAITSFSEQTYNDLDLTGLVAYTLNWLIDAAIPTSFENVVVAAFRMFPSKFALVGFPEYPDAARVNRSLLQLGPKYRNWARGSVQKGFVLTDRGTRKVEEVSQALASDGATQVRAPRPASRRRTMDFDSELANLMSSVLFQKWSLQALDKGTEIELLDLLGAYAYTSPKVLRSRLQQLEQLAEQLSRADLVSFLSDVRQVFRSALSD
jgi:hypothetical protein